MLNKPVIMILIDILRYKKLALEYNNKIFLQAAAEVKSLKRKHEF